MWRAMKSLERVLEKGEPLVGHTGRGNMVKAGGSTVAAAASPKGEKEQN